MRRIAVIVGLAGALLAADPAIAGSPELRPPSWSPSRQILQGLKKLVRLGHWLEARRDAPSRGAPVVPQAAWRAVRSSG